MARAYGPVHPTKMARRNLTPRLQAHQQPGKNNRRKSTPSVPAAKGSWRASLLAIALLLSGAGLVTSGVWLSIQLFVNPDAAAWMDRLLPWRKIPLNRESPQTLTQIRASLSQLGQIPGESLPLEIDPNLQPMSLVLPVLRRQPHCQTDCEQIVELRLYQLSSVYRQNSPPSEIYYRLVGQLPVEGPEESLVIAPLIEVETASQGSTRPLPLSELRRFEGTAPAPGVWLYLMGQRVQAGTAIAYGHVVHYNPSQAHLSLMLPWTSSTAQVPQWQEVTGGGFPELVVNQTVDLEPQLRVYQIKPTKFVLNPIEMEAISLAEPVLKDRAYRNALLIARSGLWSPAWKWLQFIKRQHQGQMPAAALAQMDLIRLYAQLTQSEAEKTWVSPSQEVVADLNDGRWGEALQVFQASPEANGEIAALLKTDSGRLWNRVQAALRVNPDRPEVKAWGALILAEQQGTGSAIAWLRQQPKTTPATVSYIQTLLRHLERI